MSSVGAGNDWWAQRQVLVDARANAQDIEDAARQRLVQVASALQRTTLDPGEFVLGAVVIEPSRNTACRVKYGDYTPPEYHRGPCHLSLSMSLGGERQSVAFDEINAP